MANMNASSTVIFDTIVVGAGIEGSCTARYAASLGKKTLCLEQVNILILVHLVKCFVMKVCKCMCIEF